MKLVWQYICTAKILSLLKNAGKKLKNSVKGLMGEDSNKSNCLYEQSIGLLCTPNQNFFLLLFINYTIMLPVRHITVLNSWMISQ
jgi:hypothetical protein